MLIRKFSFLCAIVMFVFMTGCSKSNLSSHNNLEVEDNDVLYLYNYPGLTSQWKVSGKLYKALDPMYIANRYGTTNEVRFDEDGEEIIKSFELITFNHSTFQSAPGHFVNSLNAARKWNFYINGEILKMYPRALVSALKLQAIEKLEYTELDSAETLVYVDDYFAPIHNLTVKEPGAIHIYTRDYSKITPDRSTLYIMDDTIITREIFEAINPVYIRSLLRITNKDELSVYGRKNLKEAVILKTFTRDFLLNIVSFGSPEYNVLFVNGIQLHPSAEDKFNKTFFREIKIISKNTKEFIPYKDKFPGKRIIIMNL